MIKNLIRLSIIGSIFLMSCSSAETDNEFDLIIDGIEETKATYTISETEGVYVLSDNSSKSMMKTNDLLTGKIDSVNETDTDLPIVDKQEYDYIKIDQFNNNQVDIIASSFYAAEEGWENEMQTLKTSYQIIEGSYESFLQGETIKIKAISNEENDKVHSLLFKYIFSKSYSADPYLSKSKYTTLSDVMLINQNEIIATDSGKFHIELKYSKEVKDALKQESKN
jgi:hypothetical protein